MAPYESAPGLQKSTYYIGRRVSGGGNGQMIAETQCGGKEWSAFLGHAGAERGHDSSDLVEIRLEARKSNPP